MDKCNFVSMLKRMLRNRIVCGVRSKAFQKQLLPKSDLTLAQAELMALAAEAAKTDSTALSTERPALALHRLKGQ